MRRSILVLIALWLLAAVPVRAISPGSTGCVRNTNGNPDLNTSETCTTAMAFSLNGTVTHGGPLIYSVNNQAIANATTQLTLPTTPRKTITTSGTSGTWTIDPSGSTPVIATSGATTGQIVELRNTDSATECIVLQDKSIQTGSALALRSSSLTLCGGEAVLLEFDGTDWTEAAPGRIRLMEGKLEGGAAQMAGEDGQVIGID